MTYYEKQSMKELCDSDVQYASQPIVAAWHSCI